MSESPVNVDRVLDLAEAIFDNSASESEFVELDAILLTDRISRGRYLDYCRMQVALRLEMRSHRATQKVHQQIDIESAVSAPIDSNIMMGEAPSTMPGNSPVLGFLGSAYHGTVGFFSQELPLSCLIAAVIMGAAMLGAWAYKITPHQHIATAPSKSVPSDARPEFVFVGRITGLVDVKWSDDPNYLPPLGFGAVPLGRKYKLDAGLMEITYDTGAKVILQGPCTYEVESSSGGYLALGKLTALVEKRGEGRGARGEGSESNPQSLIPNPLFAIRTPTALVTDLGTEFGVEVDKAGVTESRVFRGSVKVQLVGGTGLASGTPRETVLRENESARVEKDKGDGGLRLVLHGAVGNPPKFARRMMEPPKLLDLLDIVAGGDGRGKRRARGVDPVDGTPTDRRPEDFSGNRSFRPVRWHRLIDGVFVPDGRDGAMQIDSAGRVFDGFPATTSKTCGSIWAEAAEKRPEDRGADRMYDVDDMTRAGQFMPDRRGLLCLHANAGITFSLEAVRKFYPGAGPSRFRAVAGLVESRTNDPPPFDGMVDLWVLVDGRLELKRVGLRRRDGLFNVDVRLGPGDRFLTLAVGDGGDDIHSDQFVLGDPVLEMAENCGAGVPPAPAAGTAAPQTKKEVEP